MRISCWQTCCSKDLYSRSQRSSSSLEWKGESRQPSCSSRALHQVRLDQSQQQLSLQHRRQKKGIHQQRHHLTR